MYIKDYNGDPVELQVSSYQQDITINYKLTLLSSKAVRSVDRGRDTDAYKTKLVLTGTKDYLNSIMGVLYALRDLNEEFVLGGFEERIFGDNVDHSGEINCVVDKIGKITSDGSKQSAIEVIFISTDAQTISYQNGALPTDCLEFDWEGYNVWNTLVNETYNRNNYMVDNGYDVFKFTGHYQLCVDDNEQLLAFWAFKRGGIFTINDGDMGVTYMFGPLGGDTTHDVIITDIRYTYVSHTLRNVYIELMKVNTPPYIPPHSNAFIAGTAVDPFNQSDWVVSNVGDGDIVWGENLVLGGDNYYMETTGVNLRLGHYTETVALLEDSTWGDMIDVCLLTRQDNSALHYARVMYDKITLHSYIPGSGYLTHEIPYTSPLAGDKITVDAKYDNSTDLTVDVKVFRAGAEIISDVYTFNNAYDGSSGVKISIQSRQIKNVRDYIYAEERI